MEVFISYEKESKDIADELVFTLEKNGKKCWYAPRDVVVSYASDIIEAISKSRLFIILLNGKSSYSKHVLNEMECAYKYFKEDKNIIIPFKVDNLPISNDMEYYIQRIQYIDAYSIPLSDAIKNLEEKIEKILLTQPQLPISPKNPISIETNKCDEEIRFTNRYYDIDDNYENKRLKIEAELLFNIEKSIYDKLLIGREKQNCLIVNTMYANGVMKKLTREEITNIIGLCYNEKACMAANYEYESNLVKFYHQDVEENDFEEKLEKYMIERNISGFDIVDITMGFLDWKNPFKVIRIISHFLNTNAVVYVRDIDDTVVFAYPDEKKLFKQFFTYYKLDPISGFRQSGRRIYSYLKKVGAKCVSLEKSGVDISNMSRREVEKMFFCYFGFIPNDFSIVYKKHPENSTYREVLAWCEEHYADLEEAFLDEDFMYNSGYLIYTAKF